MIDWTGSTPPAYRSNSRLLLRSSSYASALYRRLLYVYVYVSEGDRSRRERGREEAGERKRGGCMREREVEKIESDYVI